VKPLYLVATARQELLGAVRRYEENRPGLGLEFLGEMRLLLERVRSEASSFPKWREDRPYRKAVMVRRFPLVIFFEDGLDDVRVLAVAHGKRRPGYWLRRAPANR
jgi:toxin ParE1/3/4